MEAKREDGAVIIPDGTNMTLAGAGVKNTPVFVREDGKELLQLREVDGIVPHLSLCTVTGAWQGLPLQPLLQWLKENRPALLAPSYKPPAEWVQAAQEFISTATEQEWAEAERYYLQVYAAWTHQRSGITGVELPPLKTCPPLVQAGWLAVARESAQSPAFTLGPPSISVELSNYSEEQLATLQELIAKAQQGAGVFQPLTMDSAADTAIATITGKMGWLLLGHPVNGQPTDFEALALRHFLETGGTAEGWAALSEDERFRRKRWMEDLLVGERREIGQWIGDALTGRVPASSEQPPAAETTADGQHIRRG